MAYGDVVRMSSVEREWYCHRLVRHLKEESDAWKKAFKRRGSLK